MKTSKRGIGLLLGFVLIVSLCFQFVLADEVRAASSLPEDNDVWTITKIEALDDTVANQSILQLTNGENVTEPILPKELKAVAYKNGQEANAISVKDVVWNATPEYDQGQEGEYIYNATLPKGYVLEEGVELPEITVNVKADKSSSAYDKNTVSIYSDAEPNTASMLEDIDITLDDVAYTFDLNTENKTACLTDIADPSKEITVTVPETFVYNNVTYTVTELSWSMFPSKRSNITGLILPDTLTEADVRFIKFPNLKELTIPGSVKNFSGSLQGISKLEKLTFGEGVEELSANSMVYGCNSLVEIELPSTLKKISQPGVFSSATALTKITLPEGIEITEGGLFSDCTSLASIELPASVTVIPGSTFSGCSNLQSVTTKGTITAIGSSAFNECSSLTDIPDLGQVTKVDSFAFNECGELTGPIDLSNVTEMGAYAFYNCQKLIGALDLSNLNKIPDRAFSYTSIDAVTLSDSLTSIGIWAFLYTDITSIEFPETLTSIGTYAFWNAKKLSGIVSIPDSVTSIGNYAFNGTAVEKFKIGSGVEVIDANVFDDNTALQEIIFDNSRDNVTITGNIADNVIVTFTRQSIPDDVGDKISDAADAPTLQEAVNAAAKKENGDTVNLEKNIKLNKPVTVPAGHIVTITAEEAYQISGTKTVDDLRNLFIVEKGASLVITGNVTLFGRYNSSSIIFNKGSLEIAGDAVVTGSKIVNDLAGEMGTSGVGVIDSRGDDAIFILSGGKVSGNALNSDTVSYSGIIRASEGAYVEITGGEISGNNASAAAALNCSSGVLLYGNAKGSMSGVVISGNFGHRGSAVMLYGNDAGNRADFVMSKDAVITGNSCTSKGSVTGSGAVHVEDNASFKMFGGIISNNKGINGAGVCVVDNNLQNGQPEYNTAFVMEGGTISENTAGTGGGIYSYSNGVNLIAGEIINNQASKMGGGVYSEGNYDYYSTLHLSNALITGNSARQGGGMWFCATGKTTVYVTEGAAIFDNTAQNLDRQKGAGDDFVFSSRPQDDYSATLASRMLGGGAVGWYKDGAVYLASTGVYPTTNDQAIRYGENGAETDPVNIVGYNDCLALKAVPINENAKIAAQNEASVVIKGNTSERGGGIGANGGIVIGRDDTTAVNVTKVWADDNENDRPAGITVNLLSNGAVIDTATLTADCNWSHSFDSLPVGDKNGHSYAYTVEEVEVPGYTSSITGNAQDGFTITNTKNASPGGGDGENTIEPTDTPKPTAPVKKPEKTNTNSEKTDAPKTGDNSNTAVWLAIFLYFGIGAVITAICSRKRSGKK